MPWREMFTVWNKSGRKNGLTSDYLHNICCGIKVDANMDKSVTVCICMKRSEKSQFWFENSECIAHLSTTHSWSDLITLFFKQFL